MGIIHDIPKNMWGKSYEPGKLSCISFFPLFLHDLPENLAEWGLFNFISEAKLPL